MALLDYISLFSNSTINTKWANGKIGTIVPTENCQYIFVEHEYVDDRLQLKYPESEWKEKCPVLACGFVYHWLRNRKRKTKRAERLDLFAPEDRGKTPKEIYDLYIEARKKWFLEYMSNRPDAWKYPDLEKLFYEQNLTVESERELILKSDPLFEYIDEEDLRECLNVTQNFLDYVASIVEPYQHVMEKAARQKRSEQAIASQKVFIKRVDEEMNAKWPNPKQINDNKDYTIDSPEILEYTKNLTPLQTEILRQLVDNNGEITDWRTNSTLNRYSDQEIWDACCPLFTDCMINAFFKYGQVSYLGIEDKGKLVLRKKNSLGKKADFVIQKENVTLKVIEEKPSEPTSTQKSSKPKLAKKSPTSKPPKQKPKKVTSIDEYPNFTYNYPDNTDELKFNKAHRLITVHKCLVKWKWIGKDTCVDDIFDLFAGIKSKNLIKWLCSKSSTSVLGYLFRQLEKKSIITISKDAEGVSIWDILSTHCR